MINVNRALSARVALTLGLMVTMGCQQQMAQQPNHRPLEPSAFFPDGQSARPIPPGTVARGQLRDELSVFSTVGGKRREVLGAAAVGLGSTSPLAVPALVEAMVRDQVVTGYVDTFPMPVTKEMLARGQQRYTIFCAVCHGATGRGDGKIVERGYTPPPSFIDDVSRGLKQRGVRVLLRDVPVGYYFEVITQGYGAMPDYRAQVSPAERWAIIAYIRALQLSQHARLADLPESARQAAESALGGPK
jgi:mono/diheme cytochrome c family protein